MGNWILCLGDMEESLQQAWKECQMWSKDNHDKEETKEEPGLSLSVASH